MEGLKLSEPAAQLGEAILAAAGAGWSKRQHPDSPGGWIVHGPTEDQAAVSVLPDAAAGIIVIGYADGWTLHRRFDREERAAGIDMAALVVTQLTRAGILPRAA